MGDPLWQDDVVSAEVAATELRKLIAETRAVVSELNETIARARRDMRALRDLTEIGHGLADNLRIRR
jgi:hypothetical protein